MKPHKHAELIKAWADGAVIQQRYYSKRWGDWCEWYPFSDTWNEEGYEYRIKPEEKKPVVRWKWAHKVDSIWLEYGMFITEEEAVIRFNGEQYKKLDYTRTEFEE